MFFIETLTIDTQNKDKNISTQISCISLKIQKDLT